MNEPSTVKLVSLKRFIEVTTIIEVFPPCDKNLEEIMRILSQGLHIVENKWLGARVGPMKVRTIEPETRRPMVTILSETTALSDGFFSAMADADAAAEDHFIRLESPTPEAQTSRSPEADPTQS